MTLFASGAAGQRHGGVIVARSRSAICHSAVISVGSSENGPRAAATGEVEKLTERLNDNATRKLLSIDGGGNFRQRGENGVAAVLLLLRRFLARPSHRPIEVM
jgi:hypothetical protein